MAHPSISFPFSLLLPPVPLCLLVPPRTPTSSFLPLPLAPCGSLPLTCPRSDSPLGVLAHLGGRSLYTLREGQKFGAVLSAESPSPPDVGRTVPKAASVPTAEPGLWAGQRPLEVRLGIAALCRLQLSAGSRGHPRHSDSHTCLCVGVPECVKVRVDLGVCAWCECVIGVCLWSCRVHAVVCVCVCV